MYRLGLVVVALVAACGSSTHVSTSSTPPSGGGADGGTAPPQIDAGSVAVDGGAAGTDGSSGSGAIDGGGPVDGGGAVDGGGLVDGGAPTCALSGPTTLASAHVVTKVLVDGDQLYFLDVASAFAGLYRMPKVGGTPTLIAPVLSLNEDGAEWDFALDQTTIYLTFARLDDGFGFAANRVILIDKASGATRFVRVNHYGCTRPAFTRVTAAGGTAWLVQHNSVPFFEQAQCPEPEFNTIEVLPPGATQSRAIATLAPGTSAILADATHLFWSGPQGTFRARHDGSSVEALAPVAADQLVTDGQTLFAAVGSSVDAIAAPRQVATIYDGAATGFGLRPIAPLAVDDARVWIATPSGVVAVGKDGAGPQTIVPGGVNAVAVDATQIYYAGSSVGTACK